MAKIPRHFHFIFGLREQTEPFHLVYYLCLESCLQVNRPDRISLYYHYEPHGPYWDLIRGKLELIHVPLNEQVAQMSYSERLIGDTLRYAHHADFIRLEKLWQHGGVYADIDTLFLRPLPDHFFHQSFVIGKENQVMDQTTGEYHDSLCNALMLAEPGSAFARIWMERMPGALDGSWSNHSCRLAHILSEEHPQLVHLESSSSFYPYMWTREGLHALLEEAHDEWYGAYSVHLWSHLWWSSDRKDFSDFSGDLLTEKFIRKTDTTYTRAARRFLPREKNCLRHWFSRLRDRFLSRGNP
jgi:hypothetical protein